MSPAGVWYVGVRLFVQLFSLILCMSKIFLQRKETEISYKKSNEEANLCVQIGDVLQSTLREINGSVCGTLPAASQKEGVGL